MVKQKNFGRIVNFVFLRIVDHFGNDRGVVAVDREELAPAQIDVVGTFFDLDIGKFGPVLIFLPGEIAELSTNRADRAEHPAYVRENNVRIDMEYYLVSQLQKRLEVITTPLPIPDIARMFSAAVTRARDVDFDQDVIVRMCTTVAAAPRAEDAPQLAARLPKRKRVRGPDDGKVRRLVGGAARKPAAAKRPREKADAGVLPLFSLS